MLEQSNSYDRGLLLNQCVHKFFAEDDFGFAFKNQLESRNLGMKASIFKRNLLRKSSQSVKAKLILSQLREDLSRELAWNIDEQGG